MYTLGADIATEYSECLQDKHYIPNFAIRQVAYRLEHESTCSNRFLGHLHQGAHITPHAVPIHHTEISNHRVDLTSSTSDRFLHAESKAEA